MSEDNKELFHRMYEICKNLKLEDTFQLIKNAESQEEKEFISTISDYFIQLKQRKAIAEKRF